MEEQEVPYGKVSKGEIYKNAWKEHPEKVIGQVKDNDVPTSVKYFEDRFSELSRKVDELRKRIESTENKGSFYMQLKHLKDQLPEHDGLGDYEALDATLDAEINLIEDIIQKNRQKNTEIKTALLEELKEAVEIVSWQEAGEKIKDIRQRWIKTGQPEENKLEMLESGFQETCQDFYDRRTAFYEDRARLATVYESEYQRIIEEAKQMETLTFKERLDKINSLKQQWKDNGPVPAPIYQPLFKQFQELTGKRKPQFKDNSASLDEMLNRLKSEAFTFKEAKDLQNQLKNIRPRDDEGRQKKQEAYQQIHMVIERGFIEQQASRRIKQFSTLSEQEQKKAKSKILRELLERDKKELELISMNLEKFNTRDPKAQRMMNQKLTLQQQKISVKEKLLEELKS